MTNPSRVSPSALSQAEEYRLVRRWRRGRNKQTADALAARSVLVRHNQGLVGKIAAGYLRFGLDFDDMIQEGTIGLMRAIDKFSPARGLRLTTYAHWWIRSALQQLMLERRQVWLPAKVIEHSRRIQRAQERLFVLGREPTAEEVAKYARVSVKRVREYEEWFGQRARVVTSVNQWDCDTDDADRNYNLRRFLVDDSTPDSDGEINKRQMIDRLNEAMGQLDERAQVILRMRYDEEVILSDVARAFGISRERVRQLEIRAIHQLRSLMNEEPDQGGEQSPAAKLIEQVLRDLLAERRTAVFIPRQALLHRTGLPAAVFHAACLWLEANGKVLVCYKLRTRYYGLPSHATAQAVPQPAAQPAAQVVKQPAMQSAPKAVMQPVRLTAAPPAGIQGRQWERGFFTIAEVARRVGVKGQVVRQAIQAGTLKTSHGPGNRPWISQAAYEAYHLARIRRSVTDGACAVERRMDQDRVHRRSHRAEVLDFIRRHCLCTACRSWLETGPQ